MIFVQLFVVVVFGVVFFYCFIIVIIIIVIVIFIVPLVSALPYRFFLSFFIYVCLSAYEKTDTEEQSDRNWQSQSVKGGDNEPVSQTDNTISRHTNKNKNTLIVTVNYRKEKYKRFKKYKTIENVVRHYLRHDTNKTKDTECRNIILVIEIKKSLNI